MPLISLETSLALTTSSSCDVDWKWALVFYFAWKSTLQRSRSPEQSHFTDSVAISNSCNNQYMVTIRKTLWHFKRNFFRLACHVTSNTILRTASAIDRDPGIWLTAEVLVSSLCNPQPEHRRYGQNMWNSKKQNTCSYDNSTLVSGLSTPIPSSSLFLPYRFHVYCVFVLPPPIDLPSMSIQDVVTRDIRISIIKLMDTTLEEILLTVVLIGLSLC